MRRFLLATAAAAITVGSIAFAAPAPVSILNVSYDPTRELYQAIDAAFARDWKARTGQVVTINQSHGGSGAQARAVIDGLSADVVTLALAYDIDAISAKAKLLPANWQTRLPDHSTPYYSTIVLLVRKGNPKHIRDWNDLIQPGVGIITPNPKTSGGARWNFLAAWGYAQKTYGSVPKTREFLTKLFHNVPVLDAGSRGATTSFTQRGQGDVLIAWENEAYLVMKEEPGKYEVVIPSVSIRAEPPVAVVDANVDQHHTRQVSEAYLRYLYTKPAQTIIAQNFYRPVDPAVARQYASRFPSVRMYTIRSYGGWAHAQDVYFKDGAAFDQIFAAAKR